MDDLRARCKRMQFPGNAVIESGTNGKQKITVVYRHICCVRPMHTKVSDKKRMICRNRSAPHNGCYNRNICLLHEFRKQFLCMGDINASSRKEQRILCFAKHFNRPLKLPDVYMSIWLISSDIYFRRIFCTSQFSHHIFRKINEHRPGTPRPCNIKGFPNNPSKIFSVPDCHSVFCDASCNPYNIYLLKSIVSNQMFCHLSCKTHQWHTVIISSRKPCNQIGSSRSACNKTYSYFSGCPCIGICLMDQGHFLSWQNNFRIILLIQLVADINCTGSGIAKNCIHSFFSQGLYQ